MRYCKLCKKKEVSGGKVRFFSVPQDDATRLKWSKICGVKLSKSVKICSDHFHKAHIIHSGKLHRLLNSAVPLIGKPVEPPQQIVKQIGEPIRFIGKPQLTVRRVIVKQANRSNPVRNSNVSVAKKTSTETQSTPIDLDKEDECVVTSDSVGTQSTPVVVESGDESDTESESETSEYEGRWFYGHKTPQYKLVINKKTQTRPVVIAAESKKYTDQIRELKKENKKLREELEECNTALKAISKIFTDNQIRKLKSFNNSVQWQWEDVANSLSLHAAGPRAYKHMYRKGFPLPALSTLHRWTSTLMPKEGLLTLSLDLLKHVSYMTVDEKFCILSFDEMKVSGTYEYKCNEITEQRPANSVNVILASGLKTSWKQPVYFDFDCKITKEIILDVTSALCKEGFPVVGIVCDMGPSNRELLNDLDITVEKPWFPNPVNAEEKVFMFFDVPCLLKLMRNQFLYTGFKVNDQTIDSTIIHELVKLHKKSDKTINLNLVEEHLTIGGQGKHSMKPATTLFSNTTASALRKYFSLGMEFSKASETANFIEIVNDWFDIHNSSLKDYSQIGKEAYGKKWEKQKAALDRMNDVMSKPLVPNKTTLEFFQKGVLITNNSLEMLYQYLKKHDFKHILTRRLNLDGIQHFFGLIQEKDAKDETPTPQDFKIKMRKYILARNAQLLSGKAFSDTTDLIKNKDSATEVSKVKPPEAKKSKKSANYKDIISLATQKGDLDEFNGSILEEILRGDIF